MSGSSRPIRSTGSTAESTSRAAIRDTATSCPTRSRSIRGRSRKTAPTRPRWPSWCATRSYTSSVITSASTTRPWSTLRVPSPRDHVAISRGRRLVEALAAVAPRYAPDDQQRKRALLTELEGCAIRQAGTLLRLHETLCLLQAYPDDAKTLELVDRALEAFAARVEGLGPAARRRLHDSGVTNTTLDYPFGFPMARWLAARFPRQSDVAWAAFTDEDRLDETLSLLATTAEGDAGRGLRLVFIGIQPDFRLPLEGYYGFLVLKNGVPVSYGGGWELFGTLDFAVNIFASFRQGESAYLATQLLRAYRSIFGMRTIVIDRYQLGHESTEALRSGSFYFYHRLGFRPRDPEAVRTLGQERAKIAADASYRSPIPTLKRLAAAEVFLTLPGGHAAPERRLRATDVSALVARYVARAFGGDRGRATRDSAERVARALGASRRAAWPAAERRAFERMSLVAVLIPNLAAWSSADRRALLAVMRAKGSGSEMDYARRLDAHRSLHRILEALAHP